MSKKQTVENTEIVKPEEVTAILPVAKDTAKSVTKFEDMDKDIIMRIGQASEAKCQGFLSRALSSGKRVTVCAVGMNIAKAAIIIGPVINEYMPRWTIKMEFDLVRKKREDSGKQYYEAQWTLWVPVV